MKNTFPFAAVCGQEHIKKALLWNAINPAIGGVLISGEKGTAKTTLIRGLAELLGNRQVINLPLNITEDRLVGSIDIGKAIRHGRRELEEGLLKKADGNFLYVDEINLLSRHIANILLEVAASGVNVVEREGLSCSHPARFVLVGSMNPEEGLLSPQLLDRFGLYVEARSEKEEDSRTEILRRRLAYEADPKAYRLQWQEAGEALAAQIKQARELLAAVEADRAACRLAAELSQEGRCAGHRAELLLIEASRAIAALDGRTHILSADVQEAAAFVLPHRLREAAGLEEVLGQETGSQPRQENGGEPQLDGQSLETGEYTKQEAASSGLEAPELIEDIRQHNQELSLTLMGQGQGNMAGSGKRTKVKSAERQGRYIRCCLPKDKVQDLAFDATFRIAACRQQYRDKGALAVCILPGDLREKVREKHTGATLLFVVDASGSMGARRRMGAVKGAVLNLLEEAYQKRDSVGLVAFRKEGAETLLSITRSVSLAQKCLASLPTGGKTPLAAGLYKAYDLLKTDRIKNPDALQYLILVSDGKANVSMGGGNPLEEALAISKKIQREGICSMVLDTEEGYMQLGFASQLAKALEAQHIKLKGASGQQITDKVKQFIKKV